MQVANQQLVKQPYNKAYEVGRKRAIEEVLLRTPQQLAEENAVRGGILRCFLVCVCVRARVHDCVCVSVAVCVCTHVCI